MHPSLRDYIYHKMTIYPEYIEVAIDLPVSGTYIYGVPETLLPLISLGRRVLVQFGKQRVTAYVTGFATPDVNHKIKKILEILDDFSLFPPEMIPFFKWIADYYIWPLGKVIKCALPGGLNIRDFGILSITDNGKKSLKNNFLNPVEKEVLGFLKEKPFKIGLIARRLGKPIPFPIIKNMEKKGLVSFSKKLCGGVTKTKKERYVKPACENIPEKLSAPRKKIMEALKQTGEISVKELKKYVPTAANLIGPMEKKGLVSVFYKEVYRDITGDIISPDKPFELNYEQNNAVKQVEKFLGNEFATFLLSGVTGSGKTEVYLNLAQKCLEKKKTVLVLAPEIALISQLAGRFRARFGGKTALIHSGLSSGEKYDQWLRIMRRELPIVIGARSAVFAPLSQIGLIIVDEEHDTSYKQNNDLLYNARDLAVVRAKMNNAVAVLGSATPSVQAYYNVKTGKFRELKLTQRVKKRPLPRITIVDLKKNRDAVGPRRFITPVLHKAIKETLSRKEQILLFLNRRGFASFPVCASCGESLRCVRCDITLTMHRLKNIYKCHYCGFERPGDSHCTVCGSPSIKLLGMGTEKVEAAVKTLFPDARVARMDRDTTTRKGSVLKILKSLKKETIDILVGTQMVTKGHDFPNITLVGIICADTTLGVPDFRACERTFQILAQVAGRAGRGDLPGHVILQTYTPGHFSILAAQKQDFRAFYKTEIGFRKALFYPPFSRMIQFLIHGRDGRKTKKVVSELSGFCKNIINREDVYMKSVIMLGPVEAPISKIAGRYRWQILFKGQSSEVLHGFVRRLKKDAPNLFNRPGIKVVIDVDPVFMS